MNIPDIISAIDELLASHADENKDKDRPWDCRKQLHVIDALVDALQTRRDEIVFGPLPKEHDHQQQERAISKPQSKT